MGLGGRLGGLMTSGRARDAAAWSLYDFANTLFSFAVVSSAIGLWLIDNSRFGERDGNFILSVAIVVSGGRTPSFRRSSRPQRSRRPSDAVTVLRLHAPLHRPDGVHRLEHAGAGRDPVRDANFAYQAALITYDATRKSVERPRERGRLSGIGVGVGYSARSSWDCSSWPWASASTTGSSWRPCVRGVAIPIFVFVREIGADRAGLDGRTSWARSRHLKASVAHAARCRPARFLVARFFYTDAVNTIIVVMTIVTTRAKGMTDTQALLVLLLLTVVAIVASFGWGRLVDRLGPRRTLMIVLASWAVGLILGAVSLSVDGAIGMVMFLTAGAILGSGLGGVQVADRVLMVRLSAPERVGEFFGLYGLVGKGSQVIGQLLYGLTLLLFLPSLGVGAYQLAVLTLLGTMLLGAWILRPVSDRWEGSGEADIHAPPERLAPMTAPSNRGARSRR